MGEINSETVTQYVTEILQKPGASLFFDVDDTLKSKKTKTMPQGFHPALPDFIAACEQHGTSVGLNTAQSASELLSFLSSLSPDGSGLLFQGPAILEDGHIVAFDDTYVVLVPEEFVAKTQQLKTRLQELWIPHTDEQFTKNGWGGFPDISTPVMNPAERGQTMATVSIWEKGPHIDENLEYIEKYAEVLQFVDHICQEIDMTSYVLQEAGNGTLRVLAQGVNKASALQYLHDQGIIALDRTLYCGDGYNDIAATKLIADNGGGIIAVGNSVPEIKQYAHFCADGHASAGVVEILEKIVPISWRATT